MSWFHILASIFGLSLLIIIHEGGHYLAARYFGMRVLRYSIGFGPVLWKHQPKGSPTTFQLALIPFLAYVQIAGMSPLEDVDPDDPELFQNKSWFARATTIAAGPIANYLTASLIVFSFGIADVLPLMQPTEPMTVGAVSEGSPAFEAGLQKGDVILEANGQTISNVQELIEVTAPRAGVATPYLIERDGKRLDPIVITPRDNAGRGQIGIAAQGERVYQNISVGESAELAITLPFTTTMMQLEGIADMFKRRTTEGLGGPVMIGKVIAEAAQTGIVPYLWMLMFVSVVLGMVNLFPLPALDGGRLVFLSYELITRRRVNESVEMVVNTLGIVFLLAVMVLVTYRDIFG